MMTNTPKSSAFSIKFILLICGLAACFCVSMVVLSHYVLKRYDLVSSDQNVFTILNVLIFVLLFINALFVFGLYLYRKKIKLLDKSSHALEAKIVDRTIELDRQKQLLFNASKMATLGEISAGVAHEINNPLAAISAYAFLIEKNYLNQKDLDKIPLHVAKIGSMVERISKIVSGLKSFARDGSRDPMSFVTLSYFFEDIQDLCALKLRSKNVNLTIDFPTEDVQIYGRPVQLSQVFINLISNSIDAIENLKERWIKIEIETNEQTVLFKVIDSGLGIPSSIAQNIMEPFYTTKNLGKGTGLGLSISQGILKEHNGEIFLDQSAPHTTFVISLPKSPA